MTRYLLDLFCGAGGAARGYADAGFTVVGVDTAPQPRYPYRFVQEDALAYLRRYGYQFDVIHASPPCQAHSAMRQMPNARAHVDLVGDTRRALVELGRPYVIENVVGAPLQRPTLLCGTMFGLKGGGGQLLRHRLFESSVQMAQPPCQHDPEAPVIGVYGGHVRDRRRREGSAARGRETFGFADACKAMGIDWMTLTELSQAIPPAYTTYVGRYLMGARR